VRSMFSTRPPAQLVGQLMISAGNLNLAVPMICAQTDHRVRSRKLPAGSGCFHQSRGSCLFNESAVFRALHPAQGHFGLGCARCQRRVRDAVAASAMKFLCTGSAKFAGRAINELKRRDHVKHLVRTGAVDRRSRQGRADHTSAGVPDRTAFGAAKQCRGVRAITKKRGPHEARCAVICASIACWRSLGWANRCKTSARLALYAEWWRVPGDETHLLAPVLGVSRSAGLALKPDFRHRQVAISPSATARRS